MIDPHTESLAGLYVLGSLNLEEARSFEKRMSLDPELEIYVDELRNDLSILTEKLPSMQPDPSVWQSIKNEISGEQRGVLDSVFLSDTESLSASPLVRFLKNRQFIGSVAALILCTLTGVFVIRHIDEKNNADIPIVLTDQIFSPIAPDPLPLSDAKSHSDYPINAGQKAVLDSKKQVASSGRIMSEKIPRDYLNRNQNESKGDPSQPDPVEDLDEASKLVESVPHGNIIKVYYLSEPSRDPDEDSPSLADIDETTISENPPGGYPLPDEDEPAQIDEAVEIDEPILVATDETDSEYTDDQGNLYEPLNDLWIELFDDLSYTVAMNGESVNISLENLGMSLDVGGNLIITGSTIINSANSLTIVSSGSIYFPDDAIGITGPDSVTLAADRDISIDGVINATAGTSDTITIETGFQVSSLDISAADTEPGPESETKSLREGYVVVDTMTSQGHLIVSNLTPPKDGFDYVLWVDDPQWESPRNLGILPPDINPSEQLLLSLDELETLPTQFYITEESADGSEHKPIRIIIGHDGNGDDGG